MAAPRIPEELFTKIRKVQAGGFNPAWTQLAVKAMASEGEAAWRMVLSLPDDEAKQLMDVYISSGAASTSGQAGAGAAAGDASRTIQDLAEGMAVLRRTLQELLDPYTARVENVGNAMIEQRPMALESVLAGVPALRKQMIEVISGLTTATSELFNAAAAESGSEEPAQALFNALSTDLCTLGGRGLHSCDTHRKGFPVNPTGMIDVTLSTAPKPDIGQVPWSTVVVAIELKRGLTTNLLKEGYGQLHQRAEAVLSQQLQRSWVLGVLADGRNVEVIRFACSTGAPSVIRFCRSGQYGITRSVDSDGLALLARVMTASPAELGYNAPTVQAGFSVEKAGQEWQVQPQQVLQERGTPVYSCTCIPVSGGPEVQAVLKVGDCDNEARIIQRLNGMGVQGVPTCWHSGSLSPGKSFLIIQPFGRAVVFGDDFPAERIFQVAKDVATTLVKLSEVQVWHMDVSPGNIIVDSSGRGILVDFHMAEAGQDLVGRVTRRSFMPLTRLQGLPVTLSGELESLLYTVLYWFSKGHLPWDRDGGDVHFAAGVKRETMFCFEERVLSKVPDEAKVVVVKLKELFFKPQYHNGYNSNVAAADFLSILS